MEVIETKVKKWGNSLGIIIPSNTIEARNIKENDNVKVLQETFGMLKGKIKKPTQQIKDELRRELY